MYSSMRGRPLHILAAAMVLMSLFTSMVYIFNFSPLFNLSLVLGRMETIEQTLRQQVSSDTVPQQPEMVNVPLDRLMQGPAPLDQDHPLFIKRVRDQYLHPPSDQPYDLASNNDDPSMGQSKRIREIFGDRVENGGFFIECGALDGETRSNTLIFEKKYGWRGILVEGDPKNFQLVKKKNRKAWTVNACLSTNPYPNVVMFKQSFNVGKISVLDPGQKRSGYAEVQCLPVYSLLLALNVTTVDYFSLDVEGAELGVLKSIPWHKVNIRTLSVEFAHGSEGKDVLEQYMVQQGYTTYTQVTHPGWLANDFIFVRNDFNPAKPPPTPPSPPAPKPQNAL